MNKYSLTSTNSLYRNSSGGQLLKWKIGNRCIKTSSIDKNSLQTQFMYESYAEVLASKIESILGFNHVTYRLCEVEIDGCIKTIACESVDFKKPGQLDISFGKLMLAGKIPKLYYNDTSSYNTLIVSMRQFGVDIKTYINSIIFLDSLILNDDRHYGNFGVIINNHKKSVHSQPIFDNGNSLFCHKHIGDIPYSDDLIQYLKCKPFSISFNDQLKLINNADVNKQGLITLKARLKQMIAALEKGGLPRERGEFIFTLLNSRIDYIIHMLK